MEKRDSRSIMIGNGSASAQQQLQSQKDEDERMRELQRQKLELLSLQHPNQESTYHMMDAEDDSHLQD